MEKIIRERIEALISSGQCKLLPSQSSICIPIINRMYRKMGAQIKFADIKVYEGIIVHGHHRYIASLLSGCEIGKIEWAKSGGEVINWELILQEETDIESQELVNKFNREDAEFNGMSIEQIEKIIG